MKDIKFYLLEVLAILVGITISFWLNEYSNDRERSQNVSKALAIIRNNLERDLIAFEMEVEALNTHIRAHELFLEERVELDSSLYSEIYDAFVYQCLVEENKAGYEMLLSLELPKDFYESSTNIAILDFYDNQYSALSKTVDAQNERLDNNLLIQVPLPGGFDKRSVNEELLGRIAYLDYDSKKKSRLKYNWVAESAKSLLEQIK